MSIIKATAEGIEIDGILLKDNVDLKAYISAHRPEGLAVGIGAVKPIDLQVQLHIYRERFPGDLETVIDSHRPANVRVTIGITSPKGLRTYISSHLPADFTTVLKPIPYHKLNVIIQSIHLGEFAVGINTHLYQHLQVNLSTTLPSLFLAYISPMHLDSFTTWFFVIKQGYTGLRVFVQPSRVGSSDLLFLMHIWGVRGLSVTIGESVPRNLIASLWVWTPAAIEVALGVTRPPSMQVALLPEAEPGNDLVIRHGFYKYTLLSVELNVWTELYNLSISLLGLYKSDLDVVFRMGSYAPLIIDLPGSSGYKNLYITCRPASRIMTTIIPVYTIETKDLYVSINQGWPCGFWSTYKLLQVVFTVAYKHDFNVWLQVINGSGADMFGLFVNRAFFDCYLTTFNFTIDIPADRSLPDIKILDHTGIVYDNTFEDLYQDIIKVSFSWPRIRLRHSQASFSVELLPYLGDTVYEFSVFLYAYKQEPLRQLTTRPIVPRDGLEEPVWPDVFQVSEIDLWGNDPPEVVRKIEIKFETQIHEYYWIASEQKAVAKKLYEDWSLLVRGYLPHAQYSGQIDYVTMRSLSIMKRYDNYDQAFRAMISNFLYSGSRGLQVQLNPHGGTFPVSVFLTIRDWSRMRILQVIVEPMHTQPLSVSITIT